MKDNSNMAKESTGFDFELPVIELETKITELKNNDKNNSKEITKLEPKLGH